MSETKEVAGGAPKSIAKKTYASPALKPLAKLVELTQGGSGIMQENTQTPPQAQPNRYP